MNAHRALFIISALFLFDTPDCCPCEPPIRSHVSSHGRGRVVRPPVQIPDDAPPHLFRQTRKGATPGSQSIRQLKSVAARIKNGVVLIGFPGSQSGDAPGDVAQASGFVVSRRRRLVATAAHVADLFSSETPLYAVLDGTARQYRVERVWYHPATTRFLDEGLFARSDDPQDGNVVFELGPDLAVLQLEFRGPDLPAELDLATDEELRGLVGQPVGFVGYPCSVSQRWPSESHPAASTHWSCAIGRMAVFAGNEAAEASIERRQHLRYTSEFLM